MNDTEKVTILIADDHAMVRQGLIALINAQKNLKVIGEAFDGISTLAQYKLLEPDILIIDLAMPKMNGFEAIGNIKRINEEAKIIVLSMYDDEESIQRAFAKGIIGYLAKQSAASELINAINCVSEGRIYLSSDINAIDAEHLRDKSICKTATKRILSKRETEILKMIARGNTSKQIAKKLFISWKTVEKHRRNIMKKLDIHNAAALTRYAFDQNLIPIREVK